MTKSVTAKSAPIVGLERWGSTISEAFCPMSCDSSDQASAENFVGQLDNTALNRIHLSRIATNALKVNRSKHDISQVSDAYYLVKFQVNGESVIQHCGHEAHLQPGDFTICSSSEPYKLHFPTDYYQAVLSIPQQILREMFHVPDDYLGLKMSGESPVHGILSQFVFSLIQRMDKLEPSVIRHLEANLLDLLITSLHSEKSHTPELCKAPDQHLQHIKRFINMHLKDHHLSPEFIADAEGISKRYLHMLFKAEDSSVSRYIQQLRLEACHNALTNPDQKHLSAAEIALDWGFGDISHFHRCFKAHYQLTPRQLRVQSEAAIK